MIERTIAGGRKEGLASCFGTAIRGMLHVLAAALGISLLIAQSALAFSLVKFVGAAYLVYLGLRMLLRKSYELEAATVSPQGSRRAFLGGIFVETLNVKTVLFFLVFLPQFVTQGEPLIAQLVMLGSICVTLNTAAVNPEKDGHVNKQIQRSKDHWLSQAGRDSTLSRKTRPAAPAARSMLNNNAMPVASG